MKFTIIIGEQEKHTINYSFNKFWGFLKITVNGIRIIKDLRTYSLNLTTSYEFEVGVKEIYHVRIDKIRPRINGALRSNKYEVYVNGTLFKELND